jgi:hypothetical protein
MRCLERRETEVVAIDRLIAYGNDLDEEGT